MIEPDTVRLLRECDAGVQMGVASIAGVLDKVRAKELRQRLADCKTAHEQLQQELEQLLHRFQDDGKAPNPMAKAMAQAKIRLMLAMRPSDAVIADLMTDGCNMGVKTLHRYLNQYRAASREARDIAKRLVNLEETLAVDIRRFL
jgi:hypothetical protein